MEDALSTIAQTQDSRVQDMSMSAAELWEDELDIMGADASMEDLQAMLDKAPDQSLPSYHYLAGVLAANAMVAATAAPRVLHA